MTGVREIKGLWSKQNAPNICVKLSKDKSNQFKSDFETGIKGVCTMPGPRHNFIFTNCVIGIIPNGKYP